MTAPNRQIEQLWLKYLVRRDYWLAVAKSCRIDPRRQHLEQWALEVAGIFDDVVTRIEDVDRRTFGR